jgi:hypothetical protein
MTFLQRIALSPGNGLNINKNFPLNKHNFDLKKYNFDEMAVILSRIHQ